MKELLLVVEHHIQTTNGANEDGSYDLREIGSVSSCARLRGILCGGYRPDAEAHSGRSWLRVDFVWTACEFLLCAACLQSCSLENLLSVPRGGTESCDQKLA